MHSLSLGSLSLVVALSALGCSGGDEDSAGTGGTGGVGGTGGTGGTPTCSMDDSFDPAKCEATYPEGQCVQYVDGEATASGDGWSWKSAVRSLNEGIERARCGALTNSSCDRWQVWVKRGSHYLHQNCRLNTVRLRAGVDVYGGFVGNESSLDARDFSANETVLDGRDGPDGANHVFHVVTGADDALLDGFTITGGRADDDLEQLNRNGAGMGNLNSSPTVKNCSFRSNYASEHGAGMMNFGSSPTVTACSFVDNEAGASGAGMANFAGSNPTISDCTFDGNAASKFGGGMSSSGSAPEVESSHFENNTAVTSGGGIGTTSSELVVVDSTFKKNVAHAGGGVSVSGGSAKVTGSSFDENEAVVSAQDKWAEGGALAAEGVVTLLNDTFTKNVAAESGGALKLGGTLPSSVKGATFTGNQADYGGALSAWKATVSVEASTFTGNEAIAQAGGAIWFGQSELQIDDSVFENGKAGTSGGAIHGDDGKLSVKTSKFTENSSGTQGGAVTKLAGSAEFSGCWFGGNKTGTFGGALAMGMGASVSLQTSAFFSNSAPNGGAIEAGSAGLLSLLNCTLAGNTAENAGGAVVNAEELSIVNSILWANLPNEIDNSGGKSLAVTYTAISGGHAGTGNLDKNPTFVDLAAGNLHLSAGSICIDVADGKLAPATDLDGKPRVDDPSTPNGPACGAACADLGAYEFQPGA